MSIQHGTHQSRSGSWHAANEYQRHVPVVLVHFVVVADNVLLLRSDHARLVCIAQERLHGEVEHDQAGEESRGLPKAAAHWPRKLHGHAMLTVGMVWWES